MNRIVLLACVSLAWGAAQARAPWVSEEEMAFLTNRHVAAIEDVPGSPESDAKRFYSNAARTEWVEFNYDESKAGAYSLEDPLAFADGRKLKSAAEWPARRREILALFERELYGKMPPAPNAMPFALVSEKPAVGNFAVERRYRTWFRADKSGPFVDWLMFVPRYAKKPCPIVLHLNYGGNDQIAKGRTNHYDLPLGEMMTRGYAFMSAQYTQITSDGRDRGGDFFDGVCELWGRRDPKRTDNPGALMIWAWGLCRGLDLAERVGEIDAKRSVVVGSSRLGKAALLAAAYDERFAVCVPNQTGAVGVQLMKRDFGESLKGQRLSLPHWYCAGAWKWAENPKAQPFDQHLLLACVAPRALLLECYHKRWFDPTGEFLAAQAASPAWEFLVGKGLGLSEMPAPYDDSAARPPFGYVRRTESHGLAPHDWKWALDFADKTFAALPPSCVKVSDFGTDAEDATAIAQKALDSGARKIVFDKKGSPWATRPLAARSNCEIVFEDGVELVAKRGAFLGLRDSLLSLEAVTNVVLRGEGKGGTLRMRKADYQKPPYAPGEWRHALRICGAKNVVVENMRIVESGGDGIVIGKSRRPGAMTRSEDVVVRKCVCDRNHRQGISVISVKGLLIEDVVLSNTSGTAPQSGIDFEPDLSNECIADCRMRNCVSENNAGSGFEFYLGQLDARSPAVSVTVENCVSRNNTHDVLASSRRPDDALVQGFIRFTDCTFADARDSAIHVYSKGADTFRMDFESCTVTNACAKSGGADVSYESDTWRESPPDGFSFRRFTIFQNAPRPWFAYAKRSLMPEPTADFEGDVKIVAGGKTTRLALDDAWRKKTFPLANKTPLPRPLPITTIRGQRTTTRDAKRGEMVDLAPVEAFRRAYYVFQTDRPCTVKMAARQVGAPQAGELLVTSPGGTRYCTVPLPGTNSTEFSFAVPEKGCFRLFTDNPRVRIVLEKSSVPVGLDLRRWATWLRVAPGADGFSLWADASDGYPWALATYHQNTAAWTAQFGRGDKTLRKFDFTKREHPDWLRVDLTGAPAVLFLSPEKTFSLPRIHAYASEFGWNGADDTRALQAALDSGARRVIIDRINSSSMRSGPWVSRPLFVRSDTEIVFEPGAEIVAKRGAFHGANDCLMWMEGVSNVVIRGGAGSGLRMWKSDYQKKPYAKSEHRHALSISASRNVRVEGMHFNESGGDGIYLTWGVKDCTIRNCVCDGNHRQGMSVICAENLLIENCTLSNTSGTAPQSGIDFEPNRPDQYLANCTMRNCRAFGNAGRGFEFYFGNLSAKSRPVSIRLENCTSENDRNGILFTTRHDEKKLGTPPPVGEVTFENCAFRKSRAAGLHFYTKPDGAVKPVFRKCRIEDACAENGASDVFIAHDHRLYAPFGGVDFGDLFVKQSRSRAWLDWDRKRLPPQTLPGVAGRITISSPDGERTIEAGK